DGGGGTAAAPPSLAATRSAGGRNMSSPRVPAPAPARRPNALWALLRQRCPRCRVGKMFSGSLTMNDPCPVCGQIFRIEEGYFLGAMYFSYALSSVLLIAFYFIARALLPGLHDFVVPLVALAAYLPFVPAVFRWSRVLWVWLDRFPDPDDSSAGAVGKARHQHFVARGGPPPEERPPH